MLGDNRASALYNHIRSLERLQEAKDEAAQDFNERKKLAKEDGFDTNVIAAILKRRKNGEGQTQAFDDLLRVYEDAIEEQKSLPLDVRVSVAVRDTDDVAGDESDVPFDADERAGDTLQ
ncbi:GapR family DNA-binding domain-containing protein [Sphingomonas baiyangensis]|nr:GapR family DNA-binding domain-containing protein [Sphingomonas baiyangensis]